MFSIRRCGRGFHRRHTFSSGLREWLNGQPVVHDSSHVRPFDDCKLPDEAEKLGSSLARQLKRDKAIMGVFDEGCMGMFNAIVPDHLLNPTGVYKERLSQSSLYAAMREVSERRSARRACLARRKRA